MQLKQVLAQVNEPTYQPYYQSRGKALLAWIAYATYEPTWAETALDKALATTAAWLTERGAALLSAPPFVAVLDGRPCLVAASYYPSASSLAAGQPVAACYISYPEQEVRWRQFNLSAYAAPIPIAPPATQAGRGSYACHFRRFAACHPALPAPAVPRLDPGVAAARVASQSNGLVSQLRTMAGLPQY